mgnify:CR=1 FL=1
MQGLPDLSRPVVLRGRKWSFIALAAATLVAAVVFWVLHKPPVRTGAITIDMNNLPPPDQMPPRGGSYDYAEAVSDLRSNPPPTLKITKFDATHDSVVLDGQPLDGVNLPSGLRMEEKQESTVLLFPEGGFVVLRGVTPALWQAGAARQIHGTAGNDALKGGAADDVFVPGSGQDSVTPDAGDDYILYTSGITTILNAPPNLGDDRLDLRRFSATDLAFHAEGQDLRITSPSGDVLLKGQFSASGNIETVLLAEQRVLTSGDLRSMVGR